MVSERRAGVRCAASVCTRYARALTGGLVAPLEEAETESIIVARLSSKPMVAGPAHELKEATVRGVYTGRTKALHDRTERRTTTGACVSADCRS